MLQASENGAALFCLGIQVALDVDNRWNGVTRLPEEFQADRARVFRHLVQYPSGRRDQPIGAFLLHTGQTGQEFVGDILAEALLTEAAAFDLEHFRTKRLVLAPALCRMGPFKLEAHQRRVMNFAEVVIKPCHFQPITIRVDHAPAGEVIERGAPKHRLLTTGIHGDVAADTGRIRRRGVDREHKAGALCSIGHTARDDTCAADNGGVGMIHTGQLRHLDFAQVF